MNEPQTPGADDRGLPKGHLPGHRITWWVYADGQRIRRTAQMRGQWGYDATCECGWDSKTGGAVRGYVEQEVWGHKWDVLNGFAGG